MQTSPNRGKKNRKLLPKECLSTTRGTKEKEKKTRYGGTYALFRISIKPFESVQVGHQKEEKKGGRKIVHLALPKTA